MNNLPDIKDIHIPNGVSIFPLAYGWWVILSVVVLCVILWWVISMAFKTSRKYYALKRLEKIDTSSPVSAAIDISNLLKRICLFKYKEASALYGKEWITFLNQHAKHLLTESAANLLMYAPFMNNQSDTHAKEDADEIKHFAKLWIGANL